MEHPGRDRSRTPADVRTSTLTRRVRASALARWYARLGRRGQAAVELVLGTVAPPVVGFCVYVLVAWSPLQGALELWFWLVFAALVLGSKSLEIDVAAIMPAAQIITSPVTSCLTPRASPKPPRLMPACA